MVLHGLHGSADCTDRYDALLRHCEADKLTPTRGWPTKMAVWRKWIYLFNGALWRELLLPGS